MSSLTNLDVYLHLMLRHFKEQGASGAAIRDAAYLVCDVAQGLPDPGIQSWQSMTSDPSLPYQAVVKAMRALWGEKLFVESLEVSQRLKCVGFAWPSVQRLRKIGVPHAEARGYLEALDRLSAAVAELQGPARRDSQQRAERVRAAGEALLEAGEYLRDRDPTLHARLGGLVRRRDLVDAFPAADPLAILDLTVTPEGTLIHVLRRSGDSVAVSAIECATFKAEQALELLELWARGRVSKELSPRQFKAIVDIGQTIHRHLACYLARTLDGWGLRQIILVPDMLTRYLPLHLALICGEELQDPSVKDAVFFCDVFAVEYAPCLQAVAVSLHQRRPRQVSGVLSLADSRGDLPGARMSSAWLKSRFKSRAKSAPRFVEKVGAQADRAALEGIEKAHIVVIGTHGNFDPRNPENSYLELADGRWTMAEMLDRPSFSHSPLLVLSACEVGAAAATPDERRASGIPGALVAAGAACVVASLWPAEDVSMGLIMQHFLRTLSYPGYRPSAALFRAIRAVRRMTRDEVLAHCDELLQLMKRDGTRKRNPEQYLRVDNLATWVAEQGGEHPFEAPWFWGGLVAVGNGWGMPAGAVIVAPRERPDRMFQQLMARESAAALIHAGDPGKACDALQALLGSADGVERVRTLDLLAWARWRARHPQASQSAKRECLDLLDKAEQLARDEDSEQLLRNIAATRRKIDLEAG